MCGANPAAPSARKSSAERARIVCPRCGNENLREFRFCSVCGATLGDRSPPPRKIRPLPIHDRPYLRLSEWPFSIFFETTHNYGQWINFIMLLSVSVIIFVLYLAARGEACLAGFLILLFVFLAYWYWSSGKDGASAWSPPEELEPAGEPSAREEISQWQRRA